MEKKRRSIITIASVIALAMAILVCGVLLGCGEKPNREIPPTLPPNGIHLSAKIEEKDNYDMDDISVELLCGIDIDLFNSCKHGSYEKYDNEDNVKRRLSIIAYNFQQYYDKSKPYHESFDREKLYKDLTTEEISGSNNGSFIIEEIPFTLDEYISDDEEAKTYQYIRVDNLKDSEYDCIKIKGSQEYICYKKKIIKLPQELFSKGSGHIYIDIAVLMEDNSSEYYAAISELSNYGEIVCINYENEDGKIKFSKRFFGSPYVVDGTVDAHETKTKTPSNTKLSVEEREIDNQEAEYDIETQSDVLCSGVEGTINWVDRSGIPHPRAISNGYLNGMIVVEADGGFAVSCAVMAAPMSSASAKLRGSGNKVEIPYEFTTGGSTVFICVKSADPYPKGFSLEIKNHRHVFGEWTASDYMHSRSCACGHVESVAHTFSLLTHDAETHARLCNVCGYVARQPHSPVGAPGGDELICYSCGYKRKRLS